MFTLFDPAKHMFSVLRLEKELAPYPLPQHEILAMHRCSNIMHMVIEADHGVIGHYALLFAKKKQPELLLIAITAEYQRRGIGAAVLHRIVLRTLLGRQKGEDLIVRVAEINTPAQLFFSKCGLKCVSMVPEYYPSGETAYSFRGDALGIVGNTVDRLPEGYPKERSSRVSG